MTSLFLVRDGTLFFFNWEVTIFGTCRQFFLKNNAFQTIFFITFYSENNLFTTILKNIAGPFKDLILNKHFLCMHTHEKSHLK